MSDSLLQIVSPGFLDSMFEKISRGPYRHQTYVQRFWAQVFRGGEDECWPWLGKCNKRGYGRFYVAGVECYAHRISLSLHRDKAILDPAIKVRHDCDNPQCVNPKHLLEGSQLQNVEDMVARNRMPRGQDRAHCKLDEASVLQIRERRQKGDTLSALAIEFGVGPQTIHKIVTGQKWRHI